MVDRMAVADVRSGGKRKCTCASADWVWIVSSGRGSTGDAVRREAWRASEDGWRQSTKEGVDCDGDGLEGRR